MSVSRGWQHAGRCEGSMMQSELGSIMGGVENRSAPVQEIT